MLEPSSEEVLILKHKQEIIEAKFQPRRTSTSNEKSKLQRPQVICQMHHSSGVEMTIFKGADRSLTVALAKVMMDHAR